MKVLIYGGGAREHALAWKIKTSPLLTELYLASPNDGFASLGKTLDYFNYTDLAIKAKNIGMDLVIIGPEVPLINGIIDIFKQAGINAIGPDKKWAMLEGSKQFAKEFMIRNSIPTAKYKLLSDINEIKNVFADFNLPVVLKANGLAAGKGVFIAHNINDAKNEALEFLNGKFGEASKKIVVEEFLDGPEISLISLWDGYTLLPFITARDYKRLKDDNIGPNTGGMGSYCPVVLTNTETIEINNYLETLQNALRKENASFCGIVYSGLILTQSGIKVLEYNMRFGDPETQPLMMHLKSDLLELFSLAVNKELHKASLQWNEGKSFCVVVAADGYPFNPVKGGIITNIDDIKCNYGVEVFFAGVKNDNGNLIASGGRVLSVCKSDVNPEKYVYAAIKELEYKDKCYRNDIGA